MILVVEDERIVAQDIRETLLGFGYSVPATAASAAEAFAAVEKTRPDLVLMDIHLGPKSTDGIEMAELIRLQHATPVVFLTSYSDEATLTRARAVEPYAYLLKPFSARELRVTIEIALHRHALEERLARETALLKAIMSSMVDGVAVADEEGKIVLLNEAAQEAFGSKATVGDAPSGAADHGIYLTDQVSLCPLEDLPLNRARRGERVRNAEYYVRSAKHPEGRWQSISATPMCDSRGIARGAVAVAHDVTEQKRMHEAVAREQALVQATLANVDDGIALVGPDRRVVLANENYARMFELDPASIVGLTRHEFVAHVAPLTSDPAAFTSQIAAIAAGAAPPTADFRFERPRRRVLHLTMRPVDIKTGVGHIVVWHDITAERDLIDERDRQLTIDPLTGISNRRGAEAALAREVSRMRRTKSPLCIAMFDVDHFKKVNDTQGHARGDEVLRQVAHILSREVRATDDVARWGGEEFIAILPGPLDGARAFCERLRLAIERMDLPGLGRITLSGGIAELLPEEEPPAAIARADARLYEAKGAGRNCIKS